MAGDLAAYGGLFLSAFLAATVLPFSSEVVLAALLSGSAHSAATLVAVATAGNTLGALTNWGLGRGFARFQGRRWYPLTPGQAARAETWFQRYGVWALLLSWFPIVGDPLTVVAGVLRVGIVPFLLLVATGKAARYVIVAAAVAGVWG